MFRKVIGFTILGCGLAACNSTVPAGGVGYFDTIGAPPPPPIQQPVVTTPRPTETVEEPGDMTDSLTAAVNEALDITPPANATTTAATPVQANPGAPLDATQTAGIATDDGSIDLNQFSLDQQITDRNEAARLLEQARANRVVIEPGQLPTAVADVNIVAFARAATNTVGEKLYRRPVIRTRRSECRKFSTSDEAQRYFLANGGPQEDPLNLDGDGDGFACGWDPSIYRQLQ